MVAVVAESRVCNRALERAGLWSWLAVLLLPGLRVESRKRRFGLELGLRLLQRHRPPVRWVRREVSLTDGLSIGGCHSGTCTC